jgi:NAD-specific glutamate dehydrogenase
VQDTLADVRASVADFPDMVALLQRATAELQQAAPRKDPEAMEEAINFLQWLSADHFVFLGARPTITRAPWRADTKPRRCSPRHLKSVWACCETRSG